MSRGAAHEPPRPAAPDLAAHLLRVSLERIARFGEGLPAPLPESWAQVNAAWRRKIAPAAPEQHFLIPTGTPAFELLAWVAESVLPEPAGEPALQAGEAMLAWYFALRIQDDRVDDGAPRDLAFLEPVLAGHALALMVSAAGDTAAMLAFWQRLARDFAALALADAHQRADLDFAWDEVALARQGRKYLPMAGPLGALLLRADRGADLEGLVALVEHLSTGLQLTNDLFGAEGDLASGQRSPFLAALGLRPGLHTRADLTPAIVRGIRTGTLDGYLQRIRDALEHGPAHLPLPSPRLATHVARRVEDLAAVGTEFKLDALRRAQPMVLDLEVTRRCSVGCPHCFVRQQAETGAELPTGLVSEILEEVSGYPTCVRITGGEPFQHPGLWRILERVREVGLRDVVFNTSAVSLDEPALRRLAASGLKILLLVSLDGPPGSHDAARGPGAARRALRAIRTARALGLGADPATVLTRELVAFGIGAWHAWLAGELGQVGRLALWPIFLKPGHEDQPDAVGHMLTPADLIAAGRQVAALRARGEPVEVGDFPLINIILLRYGVPAEDLWQCGACRSRLCVQADGTVTPCHPLRLPLGRLEPGRVGGFVARALAHPDARRMASRDYPGCRGCEHLSLCGGCRAVAAGQGLSPFDDDGSCAQVRALLGPP